MTARQGILPRALLGQNSSAPVMVTKKKIPAAFGCPTVCGIRQVFIHHGRAQSNLSMSPRTESAGGGFAGNEPRRPQSNRSRVLMCGVARERVCVRRWVRAPTHSKANISGSSLFLLILTNKHPLSPLCRRLKPHFWSEIFIFL